MLLDVALALQEHRHRVPHFSRADENVVDTTFRDALRSNAIECLDIHWDSLRNPELRSIILDGFRPDAVFFHWWAVIR